MFDRTTACDELNHSILQLELETNTLWQEFKSTSFYGNYDNFPFAHRGYMMAIFSYIDLLSRYWEGKRNDQTKRMVAFLNKYTQPGKDEESQVAVQLWRHTLMHTAAPCRLHDDTTGKDYTWYLGFMPSPNATDPRPHYSIYFDQDDHIWVLVIRLLDLVADLKKGQQLYLNDLTANIHNLQAKYQKEDSAIRRQRSGS